MQPRAENESENEAEDELETAPVSKNVISPAQWPQCCALALIRFYQNAISPRTPPTCFFYPTCSHYTYQAIERFGFWRGVWLGLCRMVRCHPFAHGGYDPVPEKFVLLKSVWLRVRRPQESHKDLDE